MTVLALRSLSFSQSLLNAFLSGLKKTWSGMILGMQLSRAYSANRVAAEVLIRSGEYREHTVDSLHHELNRKSLEYFTK
jgi:hypothetical protein